MTLQKINKYMVGLYSTSKKQEGECRICLESLEKYEGELCFTLDYCHGIWDFRCFVYWMFALMDEQLSHDFLFRCPGCKVRCDRQDLCQCCLKLIVTEEGEDGYLVDVEVLCCKFCVHEGCLERMKRMNKCRFVYFNYHCFFCDFEHNDIANVNNI